MVLSLNRASKDGKVAKTTLQRALENGEISATKNDKGHWQIDESEFGRWLSGRSTEYLKTSSENPPGTPIGTPEKTTNNSVLEAEVNLLRERLSDKDDVIEDLRKRLDGETDERRRLTAMITDQRTEPEGQGQGRGFWARMFKSQ